MCPQFKYLCFRPSCLNGFNTKEWLFNIIGTLCLSDCFGGGSHVDRRHLCGEVWPDVTCLWTSAWIRLLLWCASLRTVFVALRPGGSLGKWGEGTGGIVGFDGETGNKFHGFQLVTQRKTKTQQQHPQLVGSPQVRKSSWQRIQACWAYWGGASFPQNTQEVSRCGLHCCRIQEPQCCSDPAGGRENEPHHPPPVLHGPPWDPDSSV